MYIFYILTMAISFSFLFVGEQVPFWYKFVLASIWVVLYFGTEILRAKKVKGIEATYIKNYVYPLGVIVLWTMFLWIIVPPVGLELSNISRMFSNIFNLLLAVLCAVAVTKLFGKKVICYTLWAIVLSVFVNTIFSVKMYGIGTFISYLPQAVLSTDFVFGTPLYMLGRALEVQDATIATGFFIIYYLLFDRENPKNKKITYIALALVCSYIGFKRTEFIAIIITILFILIIRRFKIKIKTAIIIMGALFFVIGVGYVIVVKTNEFQIIINYIGANVNGREGIYRALSRYYSLSPFYLGKGFTYVDKVLYESIGFATHNAFIKMFAELGAIPFLVWMYWWVIGVPKRLSKRVSRNSALLVVACTMYLFLTYCIENTLSLFCVQFCFILVPFAVINDEKRLAN